MKKPVLRQKEKPSLETIRQVLRDHVPELRRQYGIRSIELFGSYIHGQQTKRSDLYLLVEFDDTISLSLFDLVGIENELSALVGVPVDLVEKNAIRPALRRRILDEAVPL